MEKQYTQYRLDKQKFLKELEKQIDKWPSHIPIEIHKYCDLALAAEEFMDDLRGPLQGAFGAALEEVSDTDES